MARGGMAASTFAIDLLFFLLAIQAPAMAMSANSSIFREYIGAMSNGVRFSDVPVDSGVEFHFILSFAIDYTNDDSSPSPANGNFSVFWDSNLDASAVASIKQRSPNVKVALSLGGDSVGDGNAYFDPSTADSWLRNAVSSLAEIIKEYGLDGIDIDYEHFKTDPNTFAKCIGKLITTLKADGVISFASIAPFEDDGPVQSHYLALWKEYGHAIDYVNFQFYAYDAGTTVEQFMGYYEDQERNYEGGTIIPSFTTDGSGGLSPANGFFRACDELKNQGKLQGIFVWCADTSMAKGFPYEQQSQKLLSSE